MELKLKEEQIAELEANEQKAVRMKDTLVRKAKQLELQQKEVEEQKESLRVEITSLEREIESQKRLAEADRKQFEDLQRERGFHSPFFRLLLLLLTIFLDLLNKSLVKASNATQRQENLVKIQENAKVNLEQEVLSRKFCFARQYINILLDTIVQK